MKGEETFYDFHRCKLCGETAAAPLYRLEKSTVYGCAGCGFHAIDVLDPRPGQEGGEKGGGLDRKSWEYIEERLQAPDPLLNPRVELVREHSPLAGAHCLDIGAGVGQFLLLLQAAGARACGLEPSRMRREYASRKFGLALRPQTIESFGQQPENAGNFDIVTLWDVIEHVNFPVQVMESALQVLKPGGLLFIDTPSRDAAAYRLSQCVYRLSRGENPLFLETFYSRAPFGHKQIFRPEQLIRLAENAGFTVVKVKNTYAAGGLLSFLRPRNRIILVCRRPG